MPVSLGGQAPASFDLKSAQLPLLTLLLKSPDLDLLRRELGERYGDQPDFFDHDPLLIDVTALSGDELPDLQAVAEVLRGHRLRAVAVHALDASQRLQVQASGWSLADAPVLPRQEVAAVASKPEKDAETSADKADGPVPVPAPSALIIDRPLRSGQQVYARGRDLVVLAMVNPGAEVIADGHVHVYAPLRGRAIAGARGNAEARIFSLAMAPELISIAGVYRTSEVPLPPHLHGKPAQVRLHSDAEGDRFVIDALSF